MLASLPLNEREITVPGAALKLHRFDWPEPVDSVICLPDQVYFDMCLTPRPPQASGSYIGRFAPTHFEPLGRLMFVPAGLPLQARAKSGAQWSLQAWFDSEFLTDLQWDQGRLRESLHVCNPRLWEVSSRIVSEMMTPGFASATIIEALCTVIAVDLARHFSAKTLAESRVRGGLPGWRLRRIEERINADGPAPTLDELAALCAMSARHLTRAYRQQTGRSIGAVIEENRIARAQTLLESSCYSLKEIAGMLGFAQPSAFSTAFRRATGDRPSAYRARMRAERI